VGKKEFLKQIKSLQMRIEEHEAKISAELMKATPDNKIIKYWEREIAAYKNAIARAEKRLRRKR
jgi:peptidoglycan hydrolase CwlO-like protein